MITLKEFIGTMIFALSLLVWAIVAGDGIAIFLVAVALGLVVNTWVLA